MLIVNILWGLVARIRWRFEVRAESQLGIIMKEKIVRSGKIILSLLLLSFLATPAIAQDPAPVPSEKKGVVLGDTLKAGMPLQAAIELLGVPESVHVNRGLEPALDSIEINLPAQGIRFSAMSLNTKLKAIELSAAYKGAFKSGIKMGDSFAALVEKYGVPGTYEAQVARYPEQSIDFTLKNNQVVSVTTYSETEMTQGDLMEAQLNAMMGAMVAHLTTEMQDPLKAVTNMEDSTKRLHDSVTKAVDAVTNPKATVQPASATSGLVFGGNLMPGMSFKEALGLLGVPDRMRVNRGLEPATDSVEINFPNQGVLLRVLSDGQTVEAIELAATFRGTFKSGIKLGDPFPTLVEKYGMPASYTGQVARYPKKGLYFLMSNNNVLSAKTFTKDTKLVEAKLMNP